jgi:ABC-type branched-subunit amino acid transport system ATPase component
MHPQAHRSALPNNSSPPLSVDGVRLAFGGLKALDGASFRIAPSMITGLIGPNGAGKTTMFNVISGLYRSDAGSISFMGRSIERLRPHQITRLGLVRTFQIARGFPKLTVFEHLMVYGAKQPGEGIGAALVGGASVRQREAELDLSGGQKKLLEIGRALMADPHMILFDEPAAGVNPTLAEDIGDQLVSLASAGLTVLLIEHDMALIERICQRVIVMAQGRTLAEGTFADVRENREVQDAYLGGRG